MGLFQKDSMPKTAEEHRKCAEEHLVAAKTMFFTFLKTGVIMAAALIVILVISIAWFVSNINVKGADINISANNSQRFYLATKKEGSVQGVYDNNSQTNSNLPEALRYFQRIEDETIQGLPQFQVGETTVTGSDNIEYIVGDADGISLMVNSTSNVNNTTKNAYVGPGSKGEMTFYIIPTIAGNNQVYITVSLAAYQLSEPNNGEVTAKLATDNVLRKILCGHMLLFQGKDEQGNYINQIEPECGEDGTIQFTFTKADEWVINQPIEITLYWIWPYRFENLVYPGQPDSVFVTSGDAQTVFLKWVNQNKQNIAYRTEDLRDASVEMSNSDFSKWSSGYNRGDQLIGDTVAYFIWTIRTEE